MQSQIPTYKGSGNINYAQIGRLVVNKMPELIPQLMVVSQDPVHDDFSLIKKYYLKFRSLYPCTVDLRDDLERKRLLIAALFHLYQPDVFTDKRIYIRTGLSSAICFTIGMQRSMLSFTLREVVIQYKAYPEFKDQVKDLLNQLCPNC